MVIRAYMQSPRGDSEVTAVTFLSHSYHDAYQQALDKLPSTWRLVGVHATD